MNSKLEKGCMSFPWTIIKTHNGELDIKKERRGKAQ